MKSYKYLIRGGYGYNNFGDDCLMLVIHNFLSKKEHKDNYAFYCNKADYLAKLCPGANIVNISDNEKCTSQWLVFGGGTQLFSFPLTKFNGVNISSFSVSRVVSLMSSPRKVFSKVGRLFKPPQKVKGVIYQHSCMLGGGMGPFVSGSYEEQEARRLCLQMSFCLVRDYMSYNFAKDSGGTNIGYYTDLCFTPDFFNTYINPVISRKSIKKNRIGVVVRDWAHSKDGGSYIQSLQEAGLQLRKRGYDVVYILFTNIKDPSWKGLLDSSNEKYVEYNPDETSIEKFIDVLSGFDVFITARYHGAVFGALLNKPCICIEVEQKLKMISELFSGFELWNQPFNIEQLLSLVHKVFENYEQRAGTLISEVREEIDKGEAMLKVFKTKLSNVKPVSELK